MNNDQKEMTATIFGNDVVNALNMLNRLRKYDHRKTGDIDPLRGKGYVLYHLCHKGGQALSGELSSDLNISTPRMATILNRLELQGYIVRTTAKEDKRKIIVSLTETGTALVKKHDEEEAEYYTTLFERLGKDDTEAYMRILKVMLELGEERDGRR